MVFRMCVNEMLFELWSAWKSEPIFVEEESFIYETFCRYVSGDRGIAIMVFYGSSVFVVSGFVFQL